MHMSLSIDVTVWVWPGWAAHTSSSRPAGVGAAYLAFSGDIQYPLPIVVTWASQTEFLYWGYSYSKGFLKVAESWVPELAQC